MKIIIEHRKTKREINGAFSFYINKKDLIQLKEIIEKELSVDFYGGWINVDEEVILPSNEDFTIIKRQKSITNTSPTCWD
jgi:hypothetical protein